MKNIKIILLILFLSLSVYSNSLVNPFIWDDISLIVDNPYIKSPDSFLKVFSSNLFSFAYYKGNYYRPLYSLTYIVDYALWKLNAIGYHISNILFHSVCAILLYLFILYLTKKSALSLTASLLFLVHPIHTEAVTYIAGRADSLVTIFFLLALLLYLKYKESFQPKIYFILSLFCFILALLSKEIAIMLPFIIIFFDYYFPGDKKTGRIKQRVLYYLPYFLILGVYTFLRITILNFSSRPVVSIGAGFLLRLVTSIKAVIIYIGLLLFPFNLHMERSLLTTSSLWRLDVIVSVVLLAAILIFTIRLRKSYKLVSFGSTWFLINLIPVAGVFMPKQNIIMAEHWLYLPCIGFFIIMGFVFDKLIKINRKITVAVLVSLLFFYSYLTLKQNKTWKNPIQFYKRIIFFSLDSAKAHFNLALAYEKEGKYNEAIAEYNRVLEIDPNYFLVYNNIGNIYTSKNLYDEAIIEYRRCLEIEPNYFLAYNNLGNIYGLRQEYNKAIESYEKSIELNPSYSESHSNLGLLYLENNIYQKAEKEFREALRLNPGSAEGYNNLGNFYGKRGLYDEAIIHYKQAIKLKANFDKAHFNLGVIYFKKNLIDQAENEWEKALKINPEHEAAAKNLKVFRSLK